MLFKQFYLPCLSHASYLIGDETSGEAAIVDPQRDVDQYLQFAEEHRLKIKHVFLTHFHADFVAGHLELHELTGARIYLGAKAQADYQFVAATNGLAVQMGAVKLQVLETPGHTPESISIVVYDAHSEKPHAVLTGDALFVGDVGRPDLLASFGITADELAHLLYDSLQEKLLKLPDETVVYPAHGAGSMCGKSLGKELSTTIGEQRRTNYALQPMSREAFVNLISCGQPEAPAYFSYDAVMNRRIHATLSETLAGSLNEFQLEHVLRFGNSGAQLLDVRTADEFAAGHIAGSLNIPLGGKFATWAGTVLSRTQPIIIVGSSEQAVEAVTRLGRIGFDWVTGYFADVHNAIEIHPEIREQSKRYSAEALAALLSGANPPIVLDVRAEDERQTAGFIAGSLNIPLPHLAERIAELSTHSPIVVHCASGYRSSIAVSLLFKAGLRQLSDLDGGYTAWNAFESARGAKV